MHYSQIVYNDYIFSKTTTNLSTYNDCAHIEATYIERQL